VKEAALPDWLTKLIPEWAADLLKASFPWLIAFIAGIAGGYVGGVVGDRIGKDTFGEKWASMPWYGKFLLGAILGAIFAWLLAWLLVGLLALIGIGVTGGPVAALAAAIGAVVGAITIINR
jgi:hypothetical protein